MRRLLGAIVLGTAACGGSPTDPTRPPPPPPPPPANSAPVIQSLTVQVGSRTEVDTDLAVTAQVADAETAPDALTWQWTASAGTITGTGPSATWRLTRGSAATPAVVTVSLAVLESYPALENGVIVTKQHRVEAVSAPFRVHDSPGEVRTLSLTFLERFVDNSVPAAVAVADFSDACPGKQAEFDDVQFVRDTRTVVSSSFSVQSVQLNGALTHADVIAPCRFTSIINATGATEIATGTCLLTATYEVSAWKLCTSNFAADDDSALGAFLSRRKLKK
jgi:hypothetical protein